MTLKDFISNSMFYVKPSIYDAVNNEVLDYEYDSEYYHWFDFREVIGVTVGTNSREVIGVTVGTNSVTISIKGVME